MVSLGMIFKRYKYFFLLASLFLLGGASQSSAAVIDTSTLAWVCMIGQTKCCVNGEKSCCEDDGTIYETLSCSDACGISGTKQYKYTADSSCGYSTSTRTCCLDGTWSEWDGECSGSSSCSSGQCWNGTICEDKGTVSRNCSGNVANASGGTQTRPAICTSGSGWSYGSWISNCTCSSNMYMPGSCTKCPVIKNKYGSNVQTYYIKGFTGEACCQPTSCRTSLHPSDFNGTPCCDSLGFDGGDYDCNCGANEHQVIDGRGKCCCENNGCRSGGLTNERCNCILNTADDAI